MESKRFEFPYESDRVRVSLGVTHSAKSQKNDLKYASVWRAKCMDSLRKMIGCMCPLGVTHSAKSQKKEFKVGFSMYSTMYGFPYDNDRVHVSLGVTHNAKSQKNNLK